MANKREFKKSVEALTSALLDEMMASYYNEKEADKDKISQAMASVASAMGTALRKAAVKFDKKAKDFAHQAEYNKAKSAFINKAYQEAVDAYNEKIDEALKAYNEGMPKKA